MCDIIIIYFIICTNMISSFGEKKNEIETLNIDSWKKFIHRYITECYKLITIIFKQIKKWY